MDVRADIALDQVTKAVLHAQEIHGNYVKWLAWPQLWSDTSCGFGGTAGQAFTSAMTVVARTEIGDAVDVYHAGSHAYRVHKPTADFWAKCGERQLPGRQDIGRHRSVLDDQPSSSGS